MEKRKGPRVDWTKSRVPDPRKIPVERGAIYAKVNNNPMAKPADPDFPETMWRLDRLRRLTYTQFLQLVQEGHIQRVGPAYASSVADSGHSLHALFFFNVTAIPQPSSTLPVPLHATCCVHWPVYQAPCSASPAWQQSSSSQQNGLLCSALHELVCTKRAVVNRVGACAAGTVCRRQEVYHGDDQAISAWRGSDSESVLAV